MSDTRKNERRLHILSQNEVRELYERPVFSHANREDYFSLDPHTATIVAELNKPETRIYFILLLGYFRAKPVIQKFNLNEVAEDAEYVRKTYFPDEKPIWVNMSKSTRFKLVNKALDTLNFELLTEAHHTALITHLKDVATICTDPRYIFDEILAFLGQKRIALPGYTSLQELVTEALVAEQQRIEAILSQQMSEATTDRLKQIISTQGLLNSLSAYKGSARDFSPSELDRELETHQTIKSIYPELKSLIGSLELSQGNIAYYALIIKHTSVYKVRRYSHWQGLLYLTCYLYFRYWETNDKLVTAFCYLIRKYNEAAKVFAKQKIAEELELVREKLKYAGDILHYFVDEKISNSAKFGEIHQQAFKLIAKEEINAISKHLGKSDFDLVGYEWAYIDKQSRKIANSLRKLFIAIDIECGADQENLSAQIMLSKQEIAEKRKIITCHQDMIKKSDSRYLLIEGEIQTKRFEFYLYQKISVQLDRGKAYITESEKNKRLEDDLIPVKDWENDLSSE
ncbi:DUF4158 domain-containing protein [Xenorhabdus budapestensis]|uniref:Transposase n=1 Tax=Xenorhabdus budapestensis TaxID=290110 RepID=A0A2D0IW27_XENBU|nr:DUF4158 domain-containing protein [Xenorhabdus budapestensis]PHM26100.1 transposase [Xenorhabdus budapestensis]